MYFDRNATMSGAKRRGSAGMDRRPSPHRENWAAWVSSPVVWPGWIAGRAPTARVGFITGCLAGMDRRPSPHRENWAAWVSSSRLFGGMDRRSSPHRENWAAWVSPQAVKSRPLSGIAPALRAGHRNSDARQRRTSASSDWLLSICERGKSPPFTFPPITPAARSARRRLNADLWKALWRWMAARGRGQAHNLGLTGAAGQGDAGQGDAGEGDAGIHAPTGRAGRPRGPQGPETPTDAASPTRQPGFPPRRRSRW